jgi:hypothetical protein
MDVKQGMNKSNAPTRGKCATNPVLQMHQCAIGIQTDICTDCQGHSHDTVAEFCSHCGTAGHVTCTHVLVTREERTARISRDHDTAVCLFCNQIPTRNHQHD